MERLDVMGRFSVHGTGTPKDAWDGGGSGMTVRRRGLFVNLLTVFCSFVVVFAVLEVVLRLAGMGAIEEHDAPFIKHATFSPFLMFGPNVNKTFPQLRGSPARWNSQGFRMDEELPVEKSVGEYRIFALGGSTTEDLANEENLHYPSEAERILGDLPGRVRVVNCGNSAYSTAHSLVRLEFDLLPYHPDMITVMENINDLIVNFFPGPGIDNYANKYLREPYANRHDFKASFIRRSHLVIFTYGALLKLRSRLSDEKIESPSGVVLSSMRFRDGSVPLPARGAFRRNLVSIVGLAKAHGIRPVLLTQPATFTEDKMALMFGHKEYNDVAVYPRPEEFRRLFEEYNSVIAEVARHEAVALVDMYRLMGHDEVYFRDMVHMTPDGVRRFGRIYADALRPMVGEKRGH